MKRILMFKILFATLICCSSTNLFAQRRAIPSEILYIENRGARETYRPAQEQSETTSNILLEIKKEIYLNDLFDSISEGRLEQAEKARANYTSLFDLQKSSDIKVMLEEAHKFFMGKAQSIYPDVNSKIDTMNIVAVLLLNEINR